MTRYFYTDPLAAAWQAKHFGTRFTSDRGEELKAHGGVFTQEGGGSYAGPVYIHPYSLQILEIRTGDLLWRIGHCLDVWQGNVDSAKFEMRRGAVVIRRNGILFHWPEIEP